MAYTRTLIREKGIDFEKEFDIEGNIGLNVEQVVLFIEALPQAEREEAENVLRTIDFKNGDVLDFLKYIAKFMAHLAES